MQGDQWWKIANTCHYLFFEHSTEAEKYNFLKQHYKLVILEQLQCQANVCVFYEIRAIFHLFTMWTQEITRIPAAKVLSSLSNLMQYFFKFNVEVQVLQCFCYYLYCLFNYFKFNAIFPQSHSWQQYPQAL